MKSRPFLVMLLACGVPMPPQNTNAQSPQNTNAPPPQEQHVIASPNPTIDDSKTTALVEPGKVTATKARPASARTAAPMKKATKPATKPKRKRKGSE